MCFAGKQRVSVLKRPCRVGTDFLSSDHLKSLNRYGRFRVRIQKDDIAQLQKLMKVSLLKRKENLILRALAWLLKNEIVASR